MSEFTDRQHDYGSIDDQSQIKVHTDEGKEPSEAIG